MKQDPTSPQPLGVTERSDTPRVVAAVLLLLVMVVASGFWFLLLFALALSYTPSDRPGMWIAAGGFVPLLVGGFVVWLIGMRRKSLGLNLIGAALPVLGVLLFFAAIYSDI